MHPRLKSLVFSVFPKKYLKKLLGMHNSVIRMQSHAARIALQKCTEEGIWLEWKDLERIFRDYEKPEKYSYDPDSVLRRGLERANELVSVLPGKLDRPVSLELGALDAMASLALNKLGWVTHAIDITDSHFSQETITAGVQCSVMSATDLKYPDNTFDVVFSYNAFEHFDDPETALNESIRVLKLGGYLYLNFGPTYGAPLGAHGHESIPVPYMQFLWERNVLDDFCRENNLGRIGFDEINNWMASSFRTLFKSRTRQMEILKYSERLDHYGIELVRSYPACFKGKITEFDDLIVSAIEILFRKKHS